MVANKIVTDYYDIQLTQQAAPADEPDLDLLYSNVSSSEEFKLIKAIALDGKSMMELAEEMHISVSACKKRAQRAREFLRKKLKF
jgi:RNA polymerase sigma-70 factor (ECF subfamily)